MAHTETLEPILSTSTETDEYPELLSTSPKNTPLPVKAAITKKKTGGQRIQQRQGKTFEELLDKITEPAIRRIAQRAGANKISSSIFNDIRKITNVWSTLLLKKACLFASNGGRVTVQTIDILRALDRMGVKIAGVRAGLDL